MTFFVCGYIKVLEINGDFLEYIEVPFVKVYRS